MSPRVDERNKRTSSTLKPSFLPVRDVATDRIDQSNFHTQWRGPASEKNAHVCDAAVLRADDDRGPRGHGPPRTAPLRLNWHCSGGTRTAQLSSTLSRARTVLIQSYSLLPYDPHNKCNKTVLWRRCTHQACVAAACTLTPVQAQGTHVLIVMCRAAGSPPSLHSRACL